MALSFFPLGLGDSRHILDDKKASASGLFGIDDTTKKARRPLGVARQVLLQVFQRNGEVSLQSASLMKF